jgi:WD40 repeat protein
VTVSKDRNVIAYDYITQTIVGQKEDHTKPILSFAVTSDNKYIFTAAKDKQINVYYTHNW